MKKREFELIIKDIAKNLFSLCKIFHKFGLTVVSKVLLWYFFKNKRKFVSIEKREYILESIFYKLSMHFFNLRQNRVQSDFESVHFSKLFVIIIEYKKEKKRKHAVNFSFGFNLKTFNLSE